MPVVGPGWCTQVPALQVSIVQLKASVQSEAFEQPPEPPPPPAPDEDEDDEVDVDELDDEEELDVDVELELVVVAAPPLPA
jgi:hypothetical protein